MTRAAAPFTCRTQDSKLETCSKTPRDMTDINVLSLMDSVGEAIASLTCRIASEYFDRAWGASSGL